MVSCCDCLLSPMSLDSLFYAINDKDLPRVQLLVEQKADVNQSSADGNNPLDLAILINNSPMVEYLLQQKAIVDSTSSDNWDRHLYQALRYNSLDATESLLKHNADPNILLKDNKSLLYWAVFRGQFNQVKLLLKYKAYFNQSRINERSLIEWAAHWRYPDIGEYLVKHQFLIATRWNFDAFMFRRLPILYRIRISTLCYLWSSKDQNSSIVLSHLPIELFHLLLLNVVEQFSQSLC